MAISGARCWPRDQSRPLGTSAASWELPGGRWAPATLPPATVTQKPPKPRKPSGGSRQRGPGGHPGAAAGARTNGLIEGRSGGCLHTAGSVAGLNGGCVLHSSGGPASTRPAAATATATAAAAALGSPRPGERDPAWGAANPPKGGGEGRAGGSPPPVPHPVLMRSRHRAVPCPWGPVTRPAAGSGSVAQPRQPANCFHTPAARAAAAGAASGPFLPAVTGLGSPQQRSSEHQCRDPAWGRGGTTPGHGSPSIPRHVVVGGCCSRPRLQKVLIPAAADFTTQLKLRRLRGHWGSWGGSLRKRGQAKPPGSGRGLRDGRGWSSSGALRSCQGRHQTSARGSGLRPPACALVRGSRGIPGTAKDTQGTLDAATPEPGRVWALQDHSPAAQPGTQRPEASPHARDARFVPGPLGPSTPLP